MTFRRLSLLTTAVVLALLIVTPSVEAAWTVTNGWLRLQLERIIELGTTPTNGQVLVYDSGTEKYEPSRTMTIGTPATTLLDAFHSGQAVARFQIDESTAFYGFEQLAIGANANGMWNEMMKSRSTDGATAAVVSADDELGRWIFRGDDGTTFRSAAQLSVAVDGTPGSSDMPGRIVFATTADGAASTTERLRIDSAGNIRFAAKLFAALGTPVDGSVVYCSDCTFANPCAGSGTGALAKRLNGAWRCD
jgi:hypothetical protein